MDWQRTSFWEPPAEPRSWHPPGADREWIWEAWETDRLPTAVDGDRDGDVQIRRAPGLIRFVHWSYVGAGVPWQHTIYWKPPAQPAPTEPETDHGAGRRVVQMVMAPSASNAFLVALCNDGSMWQLDEGNWIQLPAVPQP
jgi:hypothetical protein